MSFGQAFETDTNGADNEASVSTTSKGIRSRKFRLCIRIWALIFALSIVISLAIVIAFIVTQKPVDLSQIAAGDRWLPHARNREPHNNNTNYVLPPANYNQLSLESLLMGAGVVQQDHVVVWLSDDRLVMSDMLGNFLLMNTSDLSHKSRVFIEKDQLKSDDKGKKIIFNSDARLVAVSTGLSQVYRHSNKALYAIAMVEAPHLKNYQPIGPRATGDEALQLFEWNPQMGAKDFVFVYESNIYYQADARQRGSALPITFTGGAFNYNGITDWLYEEEIFSSSKAVWWSPSGKYLAYASFDDRSVDRVMVPHYDSADVYPRHEEVAYPKAGTANQPLVSLWIWQKQRNVTYQVDPPTTLMNAHKNGSYYLYSAQWIVLKGENNGTEELLLSVWANRQQNEVFISACRYRHSCIESLHIQFDINGRKMWSEPSDFKIDFYSTSGYFVILPRKYDDGNVYNHIAHVNLVNASPPSDSITAYHGGPYDVKQIVGYNRQKDEIYFLSAGGSIARMLLYRARYASNGSGANSPECLTCNMESCPSSRVNFAPSGKQFVLFCHLAYHSTKTYLKKVDEISSGILLRGEFQMALSYDVPKVTYERVSTASGIGKSYLLNFTPPYHFIFLSTSEYFHDFFVPS